MNPAVLYAHNVLQSQAGMRKQAGILDSIGKGFNAIKQGIGNLSFIKDLKGQNGQEAQRKATKLLMISGGVLGGGALGTGLMHLIYDEPSTVNQILGGLIGAGIGGSGMALLSDYKPAKDKAFADVLTDYATTAKQKTWGGHPILTAGAGTVGTLALLHRFQANNQFKNFLRTLKTNYKGNNILNGAFDLSKRKDIRQLRKLLPYSVRQYIMSNPKTFKKTLKNLVNMNKNPGIVQRYAQILPLINRVVPTKATLFVAKPKIKSIINALKKFIY